MADVPFPAPAGLQPARERTIQDLCAHFAHDNLTAEQLEQRLDQAHRATALAELSALTADLPTLASPGATPAGNILTAPPDEVPDRKVVVAIMGETKRRGVWTPPHQLAVVAWMGSVLLDFREARFSAEGVEINLLAVMGGVEILVPPGMGVQVEVIPIMGGVEHKTAEAPPHPSFPLLRIRGLALMGGIEISERLPGESTRDAKRRLREERKARHRQDRGR